jgi:hypothetical protein
MARRRITLHDTRRRIRDEGGLNATIAVWLTKHVGTMWCAYLFALLAVAGFPGLLGESAMRLVSWVSQTFIQLTLLSVIMVGQAVLSKHSEMLSEQSYDDIEQIMTHLNAQDEKILEILNRMDGKQ